jgi:hypothetical protein
MAHTFRLRIALAAFIKQSIQSLLHGKNPTAPEGQHFWCQPIVHVHPDLDPDETKASDNWSACDLAYGLSAEESIKLAQRLERLLVNGKVSANDKLSVDFRLMFSPKATWELIAFLRTCGGFEVSQIIEE